MVADGRTGGFGTPAVVLLSLPGRTTLSVVGGAGTAYALYGEVRGQRAVVVVVVVAAQHTARGCSRCDCHWRAPPARMPCSRHLPLRATAMRSMLSWQYLCWRSVRFKGNVYVRYLRFARSCEANVRSRRSSAPSANQRELAVQRTLRTRHEGYRTCLYLQLHVHQRYLVLFTWYKNTPSIVYSG